MHIEDTIAAISTPIGQGGIGIVRLSGSDALKIADSIFHSPKKKKLKHTPTHRIVYGNIVDPSSREVLDEVLVSVMKAPNSYTREDVVEINCHGGPVPVRRILELVLRSGSRLAQPGEFTQRAFLNGRIDLAQAEAVLDVINSLTAASQKAALSQLEGKLSEKIESIRTDLIELSAFVEAHIDFPEEEIKALTLKDMKKRAMKVKRSLGRLVDGSQYGIILREGIKTAIIGRPNVGKSSLLNALLEQDRAIVTETPGTTRDVIEEYINIQGMPLKVMDTAGIRSVADIAEKEGVRRSIKSMEDSDLVLLVLDGSEKLHKTDIELLEKSKAKHRIVIINKSDLVQKIKLPYGKSLKISAKKGRGLKRLKNEIVKQALHGQGEPPGADIVTNVRHVKALEKALESISAFINEVEKKTAPEFLSLELRESLDAVGEIIGMTTPDEILDRIFTDFCIGK